MNDFGHAHGPEHDARLGELAEELRLLAEVLLERVEPVLRRAAADGGAEWAGCSWCPLCAAVALARGEHHDVVASVASHGTAIVTVLREALAGVPVEPVLPDDDGADAAPGGVPKNGAAQAAPRSDGPGAYAKPRGADAPATGANAATESADDGEKPSGATESDTRAGSAPASEGRPRYVSIPVQIKV